MRGGVKSDSKAVWVLALVTKAQLLRKSDIKDEEVPPRWPPVLNKGAFTEPRWELVAVDSSSVAFITDRVFKVDINGILDKRSKEALAEAVNKLATIYEEMAAEPKLDEFNWARLTKMEFQQLLSQRMALTDRVSKLGCQLCKDFDDHVSI